FGPFRAMVFLHPFLVFVLPNLLLTGAIFFSLAALTRMMLPNYVGGVVLLVGYMIASSLTGDLDRQTLAALADPFGTGPLVTATKYWTVAERNTQLLPLEGVLLYNRLLWLGVAAAIAAFGFWRFRFAHAGGPDARGVLGRFRRVPGAGAGATSSAAGLPEPAAATRAAGAAGEGGAAWPAGGGTHRRPSAHGLALPAVRRRFDAGLRARQYAALTKRAFFEIVRSVYFYALVGAGLLFLGFSAPQVGKLYGTTTYPVTYATLEILSGTFALFMMVIIAFYAGEMVWRERDLKANQIHDALPVPTGLPFLAKLTALGLVCTVLLAVVMVAGILTQAFKGYFRFELGLYLKTLFVLRLSDYALLAVLALAVHAVVNHKYMGHLIIILYYVFRMFMGQLGLEHGLYRYGSSAGELYSDMNGYGPYVTPFAWFKLYWAGVAVLLALATNL
ncbi:MAG TPA: ABC transporter permease, partial [Gammaproteobacteria bacterium]|nr:ABC transporter permease [Gammaproteobacteria bacterium]